ncbi:HAD family hydrolase [Actimicrobium sp. CCI2.3]|uniref:HAD family hydrolase n=1 Tax=Actimicrobium sp. CCI2.3 TaxID=3048616 RepID=UPI002AB515BE|nr:HAD family hydrolase [Actimicrobium sp. CCI2.3]MDY7576060.1 HAD family hydrolase [Actimicrobium sp. CCI2.3]MEB0022990.1 HAD family hydrolase [Actimicrobium sp. CCI2.3]
MQPAPIKAVLFDLDDTLWPIVPTIIRAETLLFDWLREFAPAVARDHSIETLRARRMTLMEQEPRYRIDLPGLRHAGLTEAFHASDADPVHIDGAMAIFNEARNAVVPYDDVTPALERLARQVSLGTISNGSADLVAIGLAGHFRVSIAAHQFGSAKPDPAIFQAACAALDVDPAEAVYVGDDPHLDVVGAQKAGLRAVWMNRFDRVLPDHIRPDASCTSLLELEHWLAGRIMLVAPPIAR